MHSMPSSEEGKTDPWVNLLEVNEVLKDKRNAEVYFLVIYILLWRSGITTFGLNTEASSGVIVA